MLSQLFAFPVRALVVAALFPTPPALGAVLADPNAVPAPAIVAPLTDAVAVGPTADAPTIRPVPILRPPTGPAGW